VKHGFVDMTLFQNFPPEIYLRYASLKLMPQFENPSVAGPELRDKRKRGRPRCERGRSKCKRGRYVSEAAPRFGNLCVYEPSALQKKLSDLQHRLLHAQAQINMWGHCQHQQIHSYMTDFTSLSLAVSAILFLS